MKKVFFPFLVLTLFAFQSQPAFGVVRQVPSVYPSIQAAVDASADGDTVLVGDGTYSGEGNRDIDMAGKTLTVKSLNGPAHTIIDCSGGFFSDGFSLNGFDHDTWLIEGFTITNASSAISYEYELYSKLTVRNCMITGNGTGIRCKGSSPTIENCTIVENGTGLSLRQYESQYTCSPTINNCRITNNNGLSVGPGVHCTAVYRDKCKPVFSNCVITGNECQGDLDVGGGGLYFENCIPTLTRCQVSNNQVTDGQGGGIFLANSPAQIVHCSFSSNMADNYGGAIYCTSSSPLIKGCLFWNNRSGTRGGALYCTDNSSPSVSNCTFYYNPGGSDANIIYAWRMNSNPVISNCIVWSTQSYHQGIDHGSSVMPVVSYSNVVRGFSGVGNVNVDPLFVDVADPDPAKWDLHLELSSPCIDAGSNALVPADLTTDMDSNTRIFNGDRVGAATVDMGCDEFVSILVPSEQPTIQAAIDVASTGYRVLVAPGWHSGPGNRNIDFKGKAITVRSVSGAADCVIDCQSAGRGFAFQTGETRASVLKGVTVMNASTTYGGGVWCSNASSPKIEDCVFKNNRATIRGGGIYCHSASPRISGCRFIENRADGRGGAIWAYNSSPVVTACAMVKNTAQYGGAFSFQQSELIVTASLLYGNNGTVRGGAIDAFGSSSASMTNITVTGNVSPLGGGTYFDSTFIGTMTNSILWNNSTGQIVADGAGAVVTYSDIQGGCSGEGNIDTDPQFMDVSHSDPANWDLHLYATSPCIDAGTEDAPYLPSQDFEGERRIYAYNIGGSASKADMGGDEFTRLITAYSPTYAHLQAAIDQASNGYRVRIPNGTYTGYGNKDIDFKGKAIMVYCPDGPGSAIIDCEGSGRGFHFHTGETRRALLYGVTVKNGSSTSGGAVNCTSYYAAPSSPTIRNCIFTGNEADYGGALYTSNSGPLIVDCYIVNNSAEYGGGVRFLGSDNPPALVNSFVVANTASKDGGGIQTQTAAHIANATIAFNSASGNGGGIYNYYGKPAITNSIVWGNSAQNYHNIGTYGNSPTVRYCNVGGGFAGEGNINADPLFVYKSGSDPLAWDLHLSCGSPCIDAGTNDAVPIAETDFDGEERIFDTAGDGEATVDIGADEVILVRPRLSEGAVTPASGEPMTTFRFTVKYDGGSPADRNVFINGTPFTMNFLEWDASSRIYYYETTLTPNSEYYFLFEDYNGCPARLPAVGVFDGPSVSNTCPSLTSGGVSPSEGDTSTVFRIEAYYQDPDGTPPKQTRVVINNVSHVMELVDGSEHDGTYALDIQLNPDSQYYFFFDDGYGCSVRLPTTGTFDGPIVRGLTRFVPDQFPDILTAVNSSNAYDVIIVRDGIYTEANNKNIQFGGKPLIVRSENGPDQCIIDCQGEGRAFYLSAWENSGSVIEGFTIVNGYTTESGGGIVSEAKVTIKNCKIINNQANYSGGGIYLGSGTTGSVIVNCLVSGNKANETAGWGGGIFSEAFFHPNAAAMTITNSSFVKNEAAYGGGVAHLNFYDFYCNLDISNSIFWENSAPKGGSQIATLEWWGGDLTHCNIQGGQTGIYGDVPWGEGNIDEPPLFVDTTAPSPLDWDLRLQADSPCIDAGRNDAPEMPDADLQNHERIWDGDDDGTAVADMGALEFLAPLKGDLDADGDIDGGDLARLAADMGLMDLGLFAGSFGMTYPYP